MMMDGWRGRRDLHFFVLGACLVGLGPWSHPHFPRRRAHNKIGKGSSSRPGRCHKRTGGRRVRGDAPGKASKSGKHVRGPCFFPAWGVLLLGGADPRPIGTSATLPLVALMSLICPLRVQCPGQPCGCRKGEGAVIP